MNIKEGNELLLSLARKYVKDKNVIKKIEGIIASPPPGVAVRGVYEIIRENKIMDISESDKDKFNDLFYFFWVVCKNLAIIEIITFRYLTAYRLCP